MILRKPVREILLKALAKSTFITALPAKEFGGAATIFVNAAKTVDNSYKKIK
jgi:hypothetical protein